MVGALARWSKSDTSTVLEARSSASALCHNWFSQERNLTIVAGGSYPVFGLSSEEAELCNFVLHFQGIRAIVIVYQASRIQVIDLNLPSFEAYDQEFQQLISVSKLCLLGQA